MATAFQADAFQNDAFQIDGGPPPPPAGGDGLERVTLGVRDALRAAAFPSLGGGTSWLRGWGLGDPLPSEPPR